MKTTIAKWGNSLAIRLPAKLVERMNLKVGDELNIDIKGDKILLSPVKFIK